MNSTKQSRRWMGAWPHLLLVGALLPVPACAARPVRAHPPVVVTAIPRPNELAEPEPPRPAFREVSWESSEPEAAAKALADARPLLVVFDAEWCAACVKMRRETFTDPRVSSAAARFVAVRVDVTDDAEPEGQDAMRRYQVQGLPTLVLVDASGREQKRLTDFVGPDALLEVMRSVR